MSRGELVRLSRVGYSTIAEIENGGIASSGKVPTLARVLNISAEWLATGRGSLEPSNVSPGSDVRGPATPESVAQDLAQLLAGSSPAFRSAIAGTLQSLTAAPDDEQVRDALADILARATSTKREK